MHCCCVIRIKLSSCVFIECRGIAGAGAIYPGRSPMEDAYSYFANRNPMDPAALLGEFVLKLFHIFLHFLTS